MKVKDIKDIITIVRDEEIEELYPVTKLNRIEIKNLFCESYYKDQFLKKNNIIYHKKNIALDYIVNELLGEIISEYFNLETVNSRIYKVSKNYILLSELFTETGSKYSYIDELFVNYNRRAYNSFDNLNYLDKIKCGNKVINVNEGSLKKLLCDLKTMIVRDFVTNNKDRHSRNFMFFYEDDIVKLMPLYDYEYSFLDGGYRDCNVFSVNLDNENTVKAFRDDDRFQEVLELAMKLDMKKIINLFEEKYPFSLSKLDMENYISIVKEKQNMIKQYKLIR